MGCGCCSSATRPATSRSSTTSRRGCGSTSRGALPRTATSSGSRSTAPSSSDCPAKPRRRSRKRSALPARSIRTRSRCRSPRLIPAPICTGRRSRTAGSTSSHAELIDDRGVQIAPLHYPHLSHTEIFESLETFYKRFYFRRGKIASLVAEMIKSPRDDAPPPARGCRILPVPAQPGDGELRSLIVCADDFGLDPAVNEAVEEAHRHGILSTASLMVGAPGGG